jgi:drug/metabolite transporter (DMT)-like permease
MPVGRQAILAVVLAVVLWAMCSLFVRAGDSDAMVFTTWRLWIAVPPLAAIVAVRRRGPGSVPLWPPDVPKVRWTLLMFGAGALFVSGAATTFAALDLTRLLDVTLIGALQPILIIGFAVAFLHETVRRSHLVRAFVAVAATIFVTFAASSSGSWSLAGDVMAVISLVLNAGWFIYGRVLRTNFDIDPFSFMFATLFAGAVVLTPVTLIVHGSLAISGKGLFFACCVVIAGTGAHLLMIWAHRYVPTSISSPLLLLEPPIVAAGAWVWFGESLNAAEIIGSAVVVGSLWGVVRSPELEEVEHDLPDPVPPT